MAKKIVILGAGESGVGAALLAKSKGFDVFVSDKNSIASGYKTELLNNNIKFEEGTHSIDIILSVNEVIKSPGIPDNAEIILKIKEKNIPIIGEIEFAGRYSNALMIGVTGSNGKTTVVEWINHLFTLANMNFALAGNVGKSPCRILVDKNPDVFVIELSSFQLDTMFDFKCDIAVLTNISPDHLDRYDNKIENYIDSKFRICNNQDEESYFIYPNDDLYIKKAVSNKNIAAKEITFSLNKNSDIQIKDNLLVVNWKENKFSIDINNISLKGKHNLKNAMVVAVVGLIVDIKPEYIKESLSTFKGVEHRLEFVGNYNGVEFINDSKATNVDATFFALEGVSKPIVWIVGGTDKGNDYTQLDSLIEKNIKAAVFLGIDNKKLISHFENKISLWKEAKSMEEAVKYAKEFAEEGDVVLLSPACASFDLFKSYEDRGEQFKKQVLEIK